MKRIYILVTLSLLFSGIIGVSPLNTQANPVYIVTAITDGQAKVSFSNGGSSALSVGAILQPGDVVETDGLSSVWVLCQDMTTDIISGTRTPNCNANTTAIWEYRGQQVVERQRRSTGEILRVLMPRNTRLLYGNPTFEWTSVSAAKTYTLTVRLADTSLVWEKTNISGNTLQYPNDELYLRALDPTGKPLEYLVSIKAYDANGREISTLPDTDNDDTVTVATPEEQRQAEEVLQSLQSADLPTQSANSLNSYLRALYFYSQGYFGEALQAITPLVKVSLEDNFPQQDISPEDIESSPYLYGLLGDVYVAVSIPEAAFLAYTRALQLSENLSDLNMQAQFYVKLVAFSTRSDALKNYEEAMRLYNSIGNTKAAEALQSEIDKLK